MLRRPIAIRAAILAYVVAAVAWAADVTGKWSGDTGGPDGGMTLTATFKQDGTKLTGTIDGPGGETMQIQDGRVDGDKIVFSVAFNDMKIVHEGTIKGDTISSRLRWTAGEARDR